MLKVTDKDLTQHLSEYIKKVQKGPVVIEEQGHPAAVLLSYQHLMKLLDDSYWGQLAQEVEQTADYLDFEKSMALLNNFLQEEDGPEKKVLMEEKAKYSAKKNEED